MAQANPIQGVIDAFGVTLSGPKLHYSQTQYQIRRTHQQIADAPANSGPEGGKLLRDENGIEWVLDTAWLKNYEDYLSTITFKVPNLGPEIIEPVSKAEVEAIEADYQAALATGQEPSISPERDARQRLNLDRLVELMQGINLATTQGTPTFIAQTRLTDTQKQAVIESMAKQGGGFVQALAECLRRADPWNQAKLELVFRNYIDEYLPKPTTETRP